MSHCQCGLPAPACAFVSFSPAAAARAARTGTPRVPPTPRALAACETDGGARWLTASKSGSSFRPPPAPRSSAYVRDSTSASAPRSAAAVVDEVHELGREQNAHGRRLGLKRERLGVRARAREQRDLA